ncbi:LysR family transcriptional regulator [Streptomyces sp. NPDC059474]|uniref:helix-turn-helix domain-containing protein n=1 Tax=unclassified Streptomyces TaxID=2593676 RepID=UPI0033CE5CB6
MTSGVSNRLPVPWRPGGPVRCIHLATSVAVVRLGSFAAAAQELGYTQSAVSQQVAELERRAGLRVIQRRPVRPTAAGLVLLEAQGSVRTAMTSR